MMNGIIKHLIFEEEVVKPEVARESYGPYGQRPHTVHTVDHTAKSLISPFSPYVAWAAGRAFLSHFFYPTEMSSSEI